MFLLKVMLLLIGEVLGDFFGFVDLQDENLLSLLYSSDLYISENILSSFKS